MREIRPSGLAGGVAQTNAPSLPLPSRSGRLVRSRQPALVRDPPAGARPAAHVLHHAGDQQADAGPHRQPEWAEEDGTHQDARYLMIERPRNTTLVRREHRQNHDDLRDDAAADGERFGVIANRLGHATKVRRKARKRNLRDAAKRVSGRGKPAPPAAESGSCRRCRAAGPEPPKRSSFVESTRSHRREASVRRTHPAAKPSPPLQIAQHEPVAVGRRRAQGERFALQRRDAHRLARARAKRRLFAAQPEELTVEREGGRVLRSIAAPPNSASSGGRSTPPGTTALRPARGFWRRLRGTPRAALSRSSGRALPRDR